MNVLNAVDLDVALGTGTATSITWPSSTSIQKLRPVFMEVFLTLSLGDNQNGIVHFGTHK